MKYRKESPICATENMPLFVMCVRKQLSREQERALDKHIQQCTDCRMNFAYVEEILKCKHPLSSDEKSLLLKYVNDPLWFQSINDAKKHIREEIIGEVKDLLKEANIDLAKVNSNSNNRNLSSTPASNPTVSNKPNGKALPKLPPQRFPILLAAALILVFFSLSTSIYLVVNKQSSSSVTPLVSSPIPNLPIINTNSTTNSTSANNLYQQLDTFIDQFLESKNNSYLEQAETIANEIENKYEDKYGVSLVSYYKSVPSLAIDQLLIHRKKLTELTTQSTGDSYKQRLEDSQKLEKNFLVLGNLIEAYRVKTLINKFHALLHNYELSKSSTEEGLKFSRENKYLFLEGYFLLWQARQLSEIAPFEESEKVFQQTIEIGKRISLDDLVISSGMSLSALYHNNNDNEKSLEIAQSLLAKSEKLKKDRVVTLMQFAGIAAANLKYIELSNFYLKESVRLGEELNNPAFVSRSYMLLSLTLAESKNFNDSEQYHIKATNAANELQDYNSRLDTLSIISGYYGKTKLLQGNFSEAANIYKQTLEMMKELNLKNNLELSQINGGLAIALTELKNPTQAQEYTAAASRYRRLAENNNEKTNCLLSFMPNPCLVK